MAPNPEVKPKYTQIFINNEFVNSVSGKTFKKINPATGELLATVQEGDAADIDRAVAAARQAFKRGSPWRVMDASARGDLLRKWGSLIMRDADHIANLETLEKGTPYMENAAFTARLENTLKYVSGWADKVAGETLPADGNVFAYTRKEPVGVVGCITPWNGPNLMFVGKTATALAAGCTVVVKPAEDTPLGALHLAALAREAGFPPGVLNVVTGYGHTAGSALAHHMDVNKISFTGSTAVGKLIQKAAAESNLKRVTLELGGKSPLVIFDDADLEEAVLVAQSCCMVLAGQVCVAPTRCFVQSTIYDKFVAASRELAAKRVVSDPFNPKAVQSSQINEKQYKRILELIQSGIAEGAKLETGGGPVSKDQKGFFVQPTVFSNVKDDMRIAKEEIFGPVQSILKFDTLEEAIERANATSYGLGAGVYTKDVNRALEFAHGVEAGFVWVNQYMNMSPQCPFGGYKMSGLGRENGSEGIEEYFETKTVSIKVNQKNS